MTQARTSKRSGGLLLAALVAAAVALWYFFGRAPGEQITYQTQTIDRGDIESIVNTSGAISPVVTVDIGSEISGLIAEIAVDFNSKVEAGQVLARIDDRTIRARLQQNEADLAAAQANLAQQRASLVKAQADAERWSLELKRQQQLVERKLVSESELESTRASARGAAAQVELARAQILAAEAQIQQRLAVVEQTRLDLERTYIRSPVAGIVIDRQIDVGQTVAASLQAPLLFQVAQDLSQMQIEANLDEADIGKVREGMNARFRVDSFPNRVFRGEVSQVRKAATVTANVVTYKVIIKAANQDQALLPGMTANIDVVLGRKQDVLRVPNAALRFRPPGAPERTTALGAGGFEDAIRERLDALQLDADKRKLAEAALASFRASFERMRDGGGGGGPPFGPGGPDFRNTIQVARQKLQNDLQGVLSAAQIEQLMPGPPGGGAPGAFGGMAGGDAARLAELTPGEVWILRDGVPTAIRIATGLADSEFSELVGGPLKEGDSVIVRAVRTGA